MDYRNRVIEHDANYVKQEKNPDEVDEEEITENDEGDKDEEGSTNNENQE